MSYILDALRKADQERSVGDVPDLDTPHWSKRRGGVQKWVWVVAGLLVINAVFLAVLFNPGEKDDGIKQPEAWGKPVQSKPVEPPKTLPQANNKPVEAPVVLQQAPVTISVKTDNTMLQSLVRPERKAVARPRQPVPSVAVTAQAAKVETTHAAPVSQSPVAPVVKPVASSKPEVPEWNELSIEFRSGFNPPRLDVHVYDEEPSRRFILVDLKKYYEGDTLESGADLEEILPGSIQLYYQGTRFRYDK